MQQDISSCQWVIPYYPRPSGDVEKALLDKPEIDVRVNHLGEYLTVTHVP